MRKVILLTLTVFIFTCLYSQRSGIKTRTYQKEPAKVQAEKLNQVHQSNPTDLPVMEKSVTDGEVTKIVTGKSANIYGSIRSFDRAISFNANTKVIGYVFRADPSVYPSALTSGTMMGTYSADYGATWSEPCMILNEEGGLGNHNDRYPNAIVFSLGGSTDMNDAQFLVAGPSHNAEATDFWQWIYSATSNLDCSTTYPPGYLDVSEWPNNTLGSTYSGPGLMVGPDNVSHHVFLTGVQNDPAFLPLTKMQLHDIIGTWNDVDGGFVFEAGEVCDFTDLLALDADGQLLWRGGYVGGDNCFGMSYSSDGQIGYIYIAGVNIDYTGGFEPQIFKTEDAGDSWDFIETDFSDWQDELSTMLPATNQGDIYPWIMQMDGAVDADGNLQLLVISRAHSSSYLSDTDSIFWTWPWPGELLQLEVNEDGYNNVIYVDSIQTEIVEDDNECAYAAGADPIGWENSLSVTMSPDEDIAFFTWVDDHSEENTEVCAPDIFGNYRYINDDVMASDVNFSFTEGTEYEGANYFTSASDFAFWKDGYWHVPYNQTVNPVEYLLNGDLDQVTHHYVDGIKFPHLLSDIENSVYDRSTISVKQNIPNPFSTVSTIEVNLDKAADLSIEILNILGQVVYTENKGEVIAGSHHFDLDARDYDSGVYFYTVKSGTASVTKKMIIE